MPDRLRAEIHQDDPFDSPEEEVFLNLQRTAAILTGRFAAELRAWGLTPAQYNVLRILRGAGPGGRTCGEVGERLVAPGPDVTRLIDRLERAGLVARERDEADRRVVRARIRRDGLARLGSDFPLDARYPLEAVADREESA